MAETTLIGWTDATFNPWIGCSRVSPGCRFCYAEARNDRYGEGLWGVNAPRRRTSIDNWRKPHRWNIAAHDAGRPTLVFCASLADVFEDRRDLDGHRADLFELMAQTPFLIWQVLTKRPENVRGMVPGDWLESDRIVNHAGEEVRRVDRWPRNVWIGTSAEDQQRADERIPQLLTIPAPVRFVSFEPLLGPIRLDPGWLVPPANVCQRGPSSAEADRAIAELLRAAGTRLGGRYIDWAIVGGESGPHHRPMGLADARQLCAQVLGAGIPLYFKQVGGATGSPAGGDVLDGRRWHEFPAQARR